MPDRNAKLTIETVVEGTEQATAKTKALREEEQALGNAAGSVSSKLDDAAAAVERVADAEQAATDGAQIASGALQEMGGAGTAATSDLAAGATGAAAGVAGIGPAAAEAGQTVSSAAGEAAASVEAVGESAESAAAKTVAASEKSELSLEEVKEKADAFKKSLEAISVKPLEDQLPVLRAIELELTAVVEKNQSGADGGKAFADAQRVALEQVRDRIAKVSSALVDQESRYEGLSSGAKQALLAIGSDVATVEDTLINAATAIRDVDQSIAETGRTSPIAIGKAAQAVETYKQTVIAARGSIDAARSEEIAALQRLEVELDRVTKRANETINTGKDHAIALQEQEQQVSALAASAGSLLNAFGKQNAATTALLGKSASLAQVYGTLKDQAGALNLNQLGAAKGAAGLAGQVGAVIVTFLAATKAGDALAATNRENAEHAKDLSDRLGELASGGLEEWFGVSAEGAKSFGSTVKDLFSPLEGAKTRLDAMQRSSAWGPDAWIAFTRGRQELDLFNAAIDSGLSVQEANRLATEENAQVLTFYRDATAAGTAGQRLWAKALEESGGSADKLAAATKKMREELDGVTASASIVGDALRAVDAALKTKNAAKLIEVAEALETAANKSKGLTKAERERLALISDILKRGKEATEEERKFAAALVQDANAGRDASVVLNTVIRLKLTLRDATEGSVEALRSSLNTLAELSRSWDLNSQKIRTAIGDTQAILDKTDGLTEAQRRNYQTTIDNLRAVDEARRRSQELESARVTTLATAEDELRNRSRATTEAITQRLVDLRALIPVSTEYGNVVRDIGAQLQTILDTSVTVSAADRGRLQNLIDLTAKGTELTQSQRDLATQLIDEATNCNAASTALNVLAGIQKDLDIATNGSTARLAAQLAALQLLLPEWDNNSIAVKRAVEGLEDLLGKTDGLTEAQRKLYERIIDGVKQIDDLTRSQKDLEKAQFDLLNRGDQLTRAQYEEYKANQAQIYAIQGKVEAQRESVKASTEQIKADEAVVISTNKLIKVVKDGKISYTNIGTEQQKVAEIAAESGDEIADAAAKLAKAWGISLEDARAKTQALQDGTTDAAMKLHLLGDKAEEEGPRISAAFDKWTDPAKFAPVAGAIDGVASALDHVHDRAAATLTIFDQMITKMAEVKQGAEQLSGEAFAGAAASVSGSRWDAPAGPVR